jgi:hypothetical protein
MVKLRRLQGRAGARESLNPQHKSLDYEGR